MKKVMLARILPLAGLVAVACTLGCQDKAAVDPAVIAEHRSRLLLAEEPEGALTPLGLREQEGGFSEGEVVLVGQIGGLPNPWKETETNFPWREGQAAFFLVDPAKAAEFADHSKGDPDHAESCPFCSRQAGNNATSIAAVALTDAAGKPIAIDARQLLEIKEHSLGRGPRTCQASRRRADRGS